MALLTNTVVIMVQLTKSAFWKCKKDVFDQKKMSYSYPKKCNFEDVKAFFGGEKLKCVIFKVLTLSPPKMQKKQFLRGKMHFRWQGLQLEKTPCDIASLSKQKLKT